MAGCVKRMTEDLMQRACVTSMRRKGWTLVAREWAVDSKVEGYGRGDLVFKKPGSFYVVEVKRRAIPKVFEQAKYYGAVWRMKMRQSDARPVRYGVWTCTTKRQLGVITSRKRAESLCTRKGVCRRLVA